jgi:hypothetical protein
VYFHYCSFPPFFAKIGQLGGYNLKIVVLSSPRHENGLLTYELQGANNAVNKSEFVHGASAGTGGGRQGKATPFHLFRFRFIISVTRRKNAALAQT